MKTKLLVATLLAGSSLFAETHFSIGVGVGGHGYAAPPVMAYRSHSPGHGYVWVDGYWDRVGPRRLWRAGYWARPSHGRGFATAPRYDGNRYNQDRRDSNAGSRLDRNSPNGNSYSGIPSGGPFANSANGGFPTGANGANFSGNRSGNVSNGNGNSINGNFSNGTSGTGRNGNSSNGNSDGRFNNPNGRR